MGIAGLNALQKKFPTATATAFCIFAPLVAGYVVTIGMIYLITQQFPKLLAQEVQEKVSLDTLIGGYATIQLWRKPINWRAENIMDVDNYPHVARKLFWIGSCLVAIVGWLGS